MFKGSLVAIVTPFAADGSIDEAALRSLVEWQLDAGTDGIVPCGTTGEGSTLSPEERRRLWAIVIDAVNGRVPVICGTGTNNTRETVDSCKRAADMGADGALVITPYYNKPTQGGLEAHFLAAAEVGLPVVMYNVPGRTSVSMSADTTIRLAQHPHIVALKDATADLRLASELHAACGDHLALLSGDDFTALPFWAAGGQGAISVTANVTPRLCAQCWDAFEAGDLAEARRIHERLLPLDAALFLETNPIPVKTAVSLLGHCEPSVRLPLLEASEPTRGRLSELMQSLDCFSS